MRAPFTTTLLADENSQRIVVPTIFSVLAQRCGLLDAEKMCHLGRQSQGNTFAV